MIYIKDKHMHILKCIKMKNQAAHAQDDNIIYKALINRK